MAEKLAPKVKRRSTHTAVKAAARSNGAVPLDIAGAFAAFAAASEVSEVEDSFAQLLLSTDPVESEFVPRLRFLHSLTTRAAELPVRLREIVSALVRRASLPQYAASGRWQADNVAGECTVIIVGCGPVGLRCAIELLLLGVSVTVVESRTRFTRMNVLHLWEWVEAE